MNTDLLSHSSCLLRLNLLCCKQLQQAVMVHNSSSQGAAHPPSVLLVKQNLDHFVTLLSIFQQMEEK